MNTLLIWAIAAVILWQTLAIVFLLIKTGRLKRTERTLEQEQTLLRALMNNLPDHIYFKDTQSRFLRVSKAMLVWFGLDAQAQILGKSDFDFFTEEHARQAFEDEQRIILTGQPVVGIEEKETWPDGTATWVSTTKESLRDESGRIVGIFGLSRDITAHKLAEEKIRRLNEELEERVKARTQQVQESLDALKKTQELLVQTEKMAALGRLVAGVTHEINTPIGIGVTAASYLDERTRELKQLYDTGAMKRSDLETYLRTAGESAGSILKNLRRATEHIQSFKQVAVDQTSGEKRRFRLKAYLDEIFLSLHPKLKQTKHTVTILCDEQIEVNSYPGVCSQIITNLVVNSLIHAFEQQAQGEIRLECTRTDDALQIRYSDNGKGMTPQELSKIFEPFYTTKRAEGGSGLGLHIVYNLVTQTLHGQITCESTPGQGTTFIMRLPIENAA